MRLAIFIGITLTICLSLIIIIQIWYPLFPEETFFKLFMTIILLIVLDIIITLVVREYLSEKDQKEKGYID